MSYLEQGLETDRAELERVRALVRETAETLLDARRGRSWCYVVRDGEPLRPPKPVSASTNSMIAFALAAAAGIRLQSPLAPEQPAENLVGRDTKEIAGLLVRSVAAVIKGISKPGQLHSGTYGPDDPFTLGWLVPLVAAVGIEWPAQDAVLGTRLRKAWPPQGTERVLFAPAAPGAALQHAFSLLRAVHLHETARRLELTEKQELPAELADEFAETLNRQLSNSQIKDASFDPAELIFAFEGLLRSPSGDPSEALVDRFFEVIAANQEHSPSWRPLRPFIRMQTGLILLPLSVEGATALARICRRLDRRRDRDSLFSRHVDLFRKYVQWLESQRVEITTDGVTLQGWHSEHVRESKTIYTWQTSQVLIFLVLYAELFRRHIAAQALAAANLSVKRDLEKGPSPNDSSESWQRVWSLFLRRVGDDAVVEQTDNRSAVLYGPPGTGKTTLAEWLAKELDWPLITVTPSDFMAQGTAAVEARAKAVFTALQEQRRAVVIFDEIDRLILDRERKDYLSQEGAFQLMTPSMLTKLNDLRSGGHVIFLVATNYVERLDQAITRPGRFDDQLLIVPPNRDERAAYLELRWAKKTRAKKLTEAARKRLALVADRTWLATYSELKALVTKADTLKALAERAVVFLPAISLAGYTARMGLGEAMPQAVDQTSRTPPYDEVLALAALCPRNALDEVEQAVVVAAERVHHEVEARRKRREQASGKA
jgi:ATPase family associated with various cellular activities (AAA)